MLTKILKNYALDDVKTLLGQVENANHSIFLSSSWLLPWLEACSKKPLLLVVEQDSVAVGLAFWGCSSHWFGDTYYLNQTGEHADDQVWIEHNDIICAPDKRDEVMHAMLQKLSEQKNIVKIIIQTSCNKQWQHNRYLLPELNTETNYIADLKTSDDYLNSLSKNTRASIRRSNKLIETKFGKVNVIEAPPTENSQMLEEIQKLHILKWGESEYGSGFTNPKFVNFHHHLLGITNILGTQSFEANSKAKLLSIKAGDFTLGYLYVLINQQDILFYLSAINYIDLGNKYKPGLSMHYFAIEHFKKLEYKTYDFLAGPARYKEQMSNDSYPVFHITLRRNTLKNKLLKFLKKKHL